MLRQPIIKYCSTVVNSIVRKIDNNLNLLKFISFIFLIMSTTSEFLDSGEESPRTTDYNSKADILTSEYQYYR